MCGLVMDEMLRSVFVLNHLMNGSLGIVLS